jgi:hypothetical protein
MVVMTNNLFLLPYWAPALRRVPIRLQLLNAAYETGERPCRGVPFGVCDTSTVEQRIAASAAGKSARPHRSSASARRCL